MRELRFRNCQDADMYNKGYDQGRTDAIDEFVEKAKEMRFADADFQEDWIEKMNWLARQLKVQQDD